MDASLQENLTVIQVIQLILAPGVMINACGLLLLTISNKFTSVLNRIRSLTEEKRRITLNASGREFLPIEKHRFDSIVRQVSELLNRARLIRNSVFCYLVAVGLFIATSICIGIDFFIPTVQLRSLILGAFLFGMIVVFAGVVFGMVDTIRGYNIVKFEVDAGE